MMGVHTVSPLIALFLIISENCLYLEKKKKKVFALKLQT